MTATKRTTDPGKLRKLFGVGKKLGLDQQTLRDRALRMTGIASLSKLSNAQLDVVTRGLEQEAIAKGLWEKPRTRARHEDRRGASMRTGRATPEQLRGIEAQWATVSRVPAGPARDAALQKLVKRIVKIDRLEWCGQDEIKKLSAALVAMGAERLDG